VKHPLIPVDQIPQDGVATVEFFGREVFVRTVDGRPKAFVNVCLHLGGQLELRGDRFVCSWHGAQYDARTGRRLAGPAPSDSRLMTLPTREEDGVLTYVYGE
jgi:nitrite reductase/ring-hydroxylating ferredoxin subunit